MPPFLRAIANAMQGKPLYNQTQQQQPMTPPNQQWTPDPNQIQMQGTPAFGQQQYAQAPAAVQPQVPVHPQAPVIPVPNLPTINRADSRTFPVVRVKHTVVKVANGNMEVWCRIVNDSRLTIDLHKVEILGTTADIRYPLRPGQEKEFRLYSGHCMPNNAYHDMDIEYKEEGGGGYFKAIHDIRYMMNADRTLSVDELNLRLPIRLIAM